jgi:hypothetical protein
MSQRSAEPLRAGDDADFDRAVPSEHKGKVPVSQGGFDLACDLEADLSHDVEVDSPRPVRVRASAKAGDVAETRVRCAEAC